jgi:hypothetical protein
MELAKKLTELKPIDALTYRHLHAQYYCPYCGQLRKICHRYTIGKAFSKIVECMKCRKEFLLRISKEFIQSSVSYKMKFLDSPFDLHNRN